MLELYVDRPEIVSEAIEPTFAYLTGRWFNQVEKARQEHGDNDLHVIRECENFWSGMRGLQHVLWACRDNVCHTDVAHNNNMRKVADYIREVSGHDPWLWKQ